MVGVAVGVAVDVASWDGSGRGGGGGGGSGGGSLGERGGPWRKGLQVPLVAVPEGGNACRDKN